VSRVGSPTRSAVSTWASASRWRPPPTGGAPVEVIVRKPWMWCAGYRFPTV